MTSQADVVDALIEERELRSKLVAALEGLEDGWVRHIPGYSYDCRVCWAGAGVSTAIQHTDGCPVPPAFQALAAARALEARS